MPTKKADIRATQKPVYDQHITVRVDETLARKIKRAALNHNIASSVIIRYALERYFAEE